MHDEPTKHEPTRRLDPPTAEAPPFRAAGRPLDVTALYLRGIPEAGSRIDDFELIEELGRGSFARVFLARQVSLGRLVALKVSHNRGQEARALAALEHDHIVRVFSEVIDEARDLRLLCMQYVAGTTMQRVIDALKRLPPERRDGRAMLAAVDEQCSGAAGLDLAALRDRELLGGLDPLEAGCWVGARLAEALAHAHAAGVLHRDVKPANVLVNRYGRPLLADFNVSVSADRPGDNVGGTLAYASPEHLAALDPHCPASADAVGPRSDVYSLGVLLHELFSGDLPRAGPLAGVPAPLARVVGRCLAPDANDRPTAAEAAEALEGCRDLLRVRRELPAGGWLTRAALARPFAAAALLVALPHVVGSVVNVAYNALRIELDAGQSSAFGWVMLAYNLLAYPLCLGAFVRLWSRVHRVWRRLEVPGPVDAAEVNEARGRALRLPAWAAVLSALGWLPGGVLFPLAIDALAGGVGARVYVQFAFSFAISGLVALTYSVMAAQFVAVRVLYPGLWADARGMKEVAAAELAGEEARARALQFAAVSIPVSAAAVLVIVGADRWGFRLLVTALMAAGMSGLWLAVASAGRLRRTVDALTGR